jgi:Spy/CpxP family protein refolding chaperone
MLRQPGRLVSTALALALAASTVASSRAQKHSSDGPAQAGQGMGAGGPFMVRNPEFQKELKLTAAQVEKVEPALRALAREHSHDAESLRTLNAADRMARQRALQKAMNGELKTALAFTPEQSRRYDQIGLQHRRFEAFSDPDVVTQLKLTSEQRRQIGEIAQSSRGRMQEILKKAETDRTEAMKEAAALSREMTEKATSLFNDPQKAAWKEMIGAPFEVRVDRPPGK